ncbi:PIG-L family deacetylase [Kaistella sp. G5-32]|uniref:PIG-L family deacetylase n=1 Tax=Kaistella gelatinilytica TaxID=2787636 RepID=A0ABS0F911_9FLAO|nr:PIG-L family deacetylase [Kaistella gelatinilytica]MBF8456151.1 PIG-L family deacetylase [Kaistella gelatinilytica]
MDHLDFENIPLAPEQCVTGFGNTLIVAPHADDESLGCGGVIALLRKYGQNVYILLLSDGTLSHPNSKEYPAERLRDIRENELVNAAAFLGVEAQNIIFCRFKDRSVPDQSSEGFDDALKNINKILSIIRPQSIFVPWRRDPHPDHQAAFQLIQAAITENAKIYEYPIWLDQLGTVDDSPTNEEAMPFRLNITSVLDQKQKAIAAHLSQTTSLISDDPHGFRISEEMLHQFNVPYETFFISK